MEENQPPEQPEAGGLSEVAQETQRLSAREILIAVCDTARDELLRPPIGLGLSALAGGLTIGLSALAVALMETYYAGGGKAILVAAVYPLGFIAVIIGRAQFFTENTLYPVVLALAERGHLKRLLWFWGLILAANLAGALLFAFLVIDSGAVPPPIRGALAEIGQRATALAPMDVFWSGVIGGWLMALVAWMVSASHWTTGQILVTWMLTFLIGLGSFVHCVASSAEILSAVVAKAVPISAYLGWLLPAVLGNIAGGVVIVSLLNYGQVTGGSPFRRRGAPRS